MTSMLTEITRFHAVIRWDEKAIANGGYESCT